MQSFPKGPVVPKRYTATLYITAINKLRFQMILCTSIWTSFIIITLRKSVAILHTTNCAHTASNYATFPEIMPCWSTGRRYRCPRGKRHGSTVGRSPAGIAGSNAAVGMDVCLLWVLSGRGFQRRTTEWRVWEWSRNLNNAEASAHWGCRAIKKSCGRLLINWQE
jgi:hypothetical protein